MLANPRIWIPRIIGKQQQTRYHPPQARVVRKGLIFPIARIVKRKGKRKRNITKVLAKRIGKQTSKRKKKKCASIRGESIIIPLQTIVILAVYRLSQETMREARINKRKKIEHIYVIYQDGVNKYNLPEDFATYANECI